MKISKADAAHKNKFGIDLWVYGTGNKNAEIVYVESGVGHLEEFYHRSSTFTYFVIDGTGTFYGNGEAFDAEPGDVIMFEPDTKIYYMGTMKLVLVTSPPWTQEGEVHVRYLDEEGNTKE